MWQRFAKGLPAPLLQTCCRGHSELPWTTSVDSERAPPWEQHSSEKKLPQPPRLELMRCCSGQCTWRALCATHFPHHVLSFTNACTTYTTSLPMQCACLICQSAFPKQANQSILQILSPDCSGYCCSLPSVVKATMLQCRCREDRIVALVPGTAARIAASWALVLTCAANCARPAARRRHLFKAGHRCLQQSTGGAGKNGAATTTLELPAGSLCSQPGCTPCTHHRCILASCSPSDGRPRAWQAGLCASSKQRWKQPRLKIS